MIFQSFLDSFFSFLSQNLYVLWHFLLAKRHTLSFAFLIPQTDLSIYSLWGKEEVNSVLTKEANRKGEGEKIAFEKATRSFDSKFEHLLGGEREETELPISGGKERQWDFFGTATQI